MNYKMKKEILGSTVLGTTCPTEIAELDTLNYSP